MRNWEALNFNREKALFLVEPPFSSQTKVSFLRVECDDEARNK